MEEPIIDNEPNNAFIITAKLITSNSNSFCTEEMLSGIRGYKLLKILTTNTEYLGRDGQSFDFVIDKNPESERIVLELKNKGISLYILKIKKAIQWRQR